MFSLLAILAVTATLRGDMLVSTTWLADNLNNPDVLIVDIATPRQFAMNHIAGARRIDRASLVVTRNGIPDELPSMTRLNEIITETGIGNAKRIVIYSREPLFATRAFFTFDYVGLGDRTSILDGGLNKWIIEGKPLGQGLAHLYAPVGFHGKKNAQIVADRRILREQLKTAGGVMLIDARPVAHFYGEKKHEGVLHAGHIPSAKCVPWDVNLDPVESGGQVFKSAENLQSIYTGIGVSGSRNLVVYCRSGMEASMTYFVLRYLGYKPQLYDGSYIEWNRNEPVARLITK